MIKDLLRGRLAIKYVFFEMLPGFALGNLVFLTIMLMLQSFRLSEFFIVHGASLSTVLQIVGYMSVSFLPVTLPISLLFAVLLTYGRLSSDSEIVAFKALGLNMFHLSAPAVTFALLVGLISWQTAFYLAPWGNRRMELIVHHLGQTKPGVTVREGVFSEGFYDIVVYANKVDSREGILKNVFIYDERNSKSPLTIIAQEGRLIQEAKTIGSRSYLNLLNGNIHFVNALEKSYTKVNFDSYNILLYQPSFSKKKRKSPLSHNFSDLNHELKRAFVSDKVKFKLKIEWHRRWAISLGCLIFAVMGVGLGTSTNKRSGSGNGMVMSLIVVATYWMSYASFESLAKSEILPVGIAVWSTNIIFAGISGFFMYRATKS